MKHLIFAIATISTVLFTACNNNSKDDSTSTEVHDMHEEALYACSMHPEVTGKKGEECSKCGMYLTEPVTDHMNHNDSSKINMP